MDLNNLELVLVRPKNSVESRPEDGPLPGLGPSLKVMEPTVLAEVADQVYETVLHEEVLHLLDTRYPCFFEVHVQVPEDNGVSEVLQGLLQVRHVLHRLNR